MIAVAYDGGFFSDVSGVSRSNGLMTARITLVAIGRGQTAPSDDVRSHCRSSRRGPGVRLIVVYNVRLANKEAVP
jgi:hypothetical protein